MGKKNKEKIEQKRQNSGLGSRCSLARFQTDVECDSFYCEGDDVQENETLCDAIRALRHDGEKTRRNGGSGGATRGRIDLSPAR